MGVTVCYGGKACVCIKPGLSDRIARCVKEHEGMHANQPGVDCGRDEVDPCAPYFQITPNGAGLSYACSECRAYRQEFSCLSKLKDRTPEEQARLEQVRRNRDKACKECIEEKYGT